MDCDYLVIVEWHCEACGAECNEEQHGYGDTYFTIDGHEHVLGERKRCPECGGRMGTVDVKPIGTPLDKLVDG